MEMFYQDISKNFQITWEVLLKDISHSKEFNPYCYHSDFYEVFKQLILSILLNEEIILLDSDLSQQELKKLTNYSEFSQFNKSINTKNLSGLSSTTDLLNKLKQVNQNWSLTLFTSGTTGLPKKVKHSFLSITRFIKVSPNKASNIWGFAYSPTHMAGVQVFFQALLNQNLIVRLFGLPKEMVFQSIEKFRITNISATPTFYRLLLPAKKSYSNVTHITSGGEKFDEKTINQLKMIFINAKITNIYASTETGTLFAANGDIFSIKPELIHFVRFEHNELLIHKSMMGVSEINSEEWYHTGDVVEVISENPLQFHFVSRSKEMINVGGYKVNPIEVEDTIRNIEGIHDVRVFSKKNSVLGNIICCEIIRTNEQLDESTIRIYLQSRLQEFKIPRLVRFVNNIPTTRSGKTKRN